MDIHLPEKESEQAEKLFAEFGLTVEQAVELFIAQSLENGTLPFIPKIKPKNKLKLDSNGKGGFIVPDDAPEDFKEWVRHG
ncbi:type II toxin-antitoxin system RelB/DinJ family antitoxin [Enterococcus sp. BWM-S5]|uniref:Type II toxin-antitoxin system RelB/DinJ family antitoxin n=1 Tax=Enterococcus larvae TaxID=2794352 RepID=A0ABS4CGG0_9ENTE|nr:type II toxin-antitoxin system RelB/DinJ family antitoxin [Enterococcus larvae]MBP1045647.1 type II toxin-antitoxin system RelB/DinJ family antitoxin [Enterococcus larvae]